MQKNNNNNKIIIIIIIIRANLKNVQNKNFEMTNVNHSLSNLVVGYYNNNKVGVIWKRMLHG